MSINNRRIAVRKRIPLIVTVAIVLADMTAVALSIYLGYSFYHLLGIGAGRQPPELYFSLSAFAVVVMIAIFELVGLYNRELSILNIQEVRKIFKATIIGLLLFLFLTFYTKAFIFSRLIITFSVVFMFILVSLERLYFYHLNQRLYRKGIGVNRILIYGAGEVGQLIAKRLFQAPGLGYLPLGFLDDNIEKVGKKVKSNSSETVFSLPVLGTIDKFAEIAKNLEIDELFVTITGLDKAKFGEVILKCREQDIKYRFVPHIFDLKVQKINVSNIDGIPLLSIREPKINPLYLIIKRLFDIIISLIALILLSPLMLLIAIIIRKDSPGPVIFKQDRCGKNGKIFKFYKFRTMWTDSKPYDWTPVDLDDKRITKFGKFLRRTSLDELPQFWNVLKGDMSIVGPRPEMPFIVETYNEIQRDRLVMKPGITGLWQVSADRGKQIHDNIEYDLYYIENCGFLMDLVIIIRTLYFAVTGIGAF
ncbi:MAG TPA: sugar transferase [candidate division Zixibacteria bacterium]|nr:sugar transferase [candidate division Zixibacteria bacterium]